MANFSAINDVNEYLQRFQPLSQLSRIQLLREMDAVWDSIGLDNDVPLGRQLSKVAQFYSHPVWVLNGVFSELDPVSRQHRIEISRYISAVGASKVADYGGGSGVLAKMIVESSPSTIVDIVEPYPFDYFLERARTVDRIRFVKALEGDYDIVIAQDVLEHLDSPINVALEIVEATKIGGEIVFANSFWPEIKCHLPATFYLRHQFNLVMRAAGLRPKGPIGNLHHSAVFEKVSPPDRVAALRADVWARRMGPFVNNGRAIAARVRRAVSTQAAP